MTDPAAQREQVILEVRAIANGDYNRIADYILRREAGLQAEVEAYKKQSVCQYCGAHHFNVTICSKCVFNVNKTHAQAHIDALHAETVRLRGVLDNINGMIDNCDEDTLSRIYNLILDELKPIRTKARCAVNEDSEPLDRETLKLVTDMQAQRGEEGWGE